MIWIAFAALGGILQGSFALPMKYTKKWKWENVWSMWSMWTLLIVPWIIGFLAIPNLLQVYAQSTFKSVFLVFFFGFIWGISAIAVGKGLDYLGLALGFSLIMGLVIAVGSILPLLIDNPQDILTQSGLRLIVGVIIVVAGMILSACAAVLKQKDIASSIQTGELRQHKSFATGLVICVVAGLTAPMLNYAFIYGDQLRITAENLGATKTLAPNAIWTIALFGGFIINFVYCMWLVRKNKTVNLYKEKGTGLYYLYTLIMGILWAGGISVYGMATANLGKLGPSIGWGIFFGMAIFWANFLGLIAKEWKGVKSKTYIIMTVGLIILLLGIYIIGWANSF
ncbi:MAG: L-rhamnose/proton symporter RhaT [Phycisphaerales bacterium]